MAGLVVDPSDHHVTHILLDEGHLWGHKRVAIPIGAVADVSDGDGVRVKLTKDQVRDLPAIELDRAGSERRCEGLACRAGGLRERPLLAAALARHAQAKRSSRE